MYKTGVVGGRSQFAILHPGLDVRAVCDINGEKVKDVLTVLNYQRKRLAGVKENGPIRGYTDYGKMLKKEKLDLVVLAVPNRFHAGYSLAALERGCHVLVEKPMCVSLDECDRMVEAVHRTGLKLAVNQSTRTAVAMQHVFDLRDEGTLGTPYYIKADYIKNKDWRLENATAPGAHSVHAYSPMFQFGSHPIDLILGLMNDFPEEVNCYSAKKRSTRKYGYPDTMSVSMRFKGGRIGYNLTMAACLHGGPGFELCGTKMDVTAENYYGQPPVLVPDIPGPVGAGCMITPVKMLLWRGRSARKEMHFLDFPPGHDSSFYRSFENLVHAIDHDVKSSTMADVVDGARTVAVCLAAEESAASGKPVNPRAGWEPLTYRGAAPKLRGADYMRGCIRSFFLTKEQAKSLIGSGSRRSKER